MSSGKQLSFAFGEVSPSLRYRSDATFYSQGLARLVNNNIRKSGGSSNRAGTIKFITPSNQTSIPTTKTDQGVRLFFFTGSDDIKYIVEVAYQVEASDGSGFRFIPVKIISSFGTIYTIVQPYATDPGGLAIPLDLKSANLISNQDFMILTFNTGMMFTITYYPDEVDPNLKFIGGSNISAIPRVGTPAALTNLTWVGNTPTNLPVCYLVTQELTDGSENMWQEGCSLNGHPHSQLSSSFDIDARILDGVKQYNVYRSAGTVAAGTSNIRGSHYALVGRVAPSATAVMFRDYVVSPDITVQPPIQQDLYPILGYVRRVVFYKERAIIVYAKYKYSGSTSYAFNEGQIGASKLGSSSMFGRPLTPNLIDAFTFTIPSDKISRITNVLAMNRLVVFTEYHTFSMRGGDNGVLTSQDVNPDIIYHEGCTSDVTPVSSGNRGFFINSDKSKLLMIKFERDDSASVIDISTLSDHLFEAKNIRHMVVINAIDNQLWILKTDGKLVSVTISEEGGVLGYSNHETDGFIEDITLFKADNKIYSSDSNTHQSPTLMLSVIREGQRYYESMAVRNDIDVERFLYADSSTVFGNAFFQDPLVNTNMIINIQNDGVGGDYLGMSELTLIDMTDIAGPYSGGFTVDWVGRVYDFFYDRLNSETNVIERLKARLYVDSFVDAGTLTAHCEEDLPEELQDIQAQDLTIEEKIAKQIMFLQAFNQVTGLEHLAGKNVSVFADGEVVASPNNPKYSTLTVDTNGELTLPTYYNYGYIGLPYTSELETLDLEASDARTFTDSGKLINAVGVGMHRTYGGFIGQSGIEGVVNMEDVALVDKSGYLKVAFPSSWEQTGRVLIKQVDPLPMSILSVYPKGVAGD